MDRAGFEPAIGFCTVRRAISLMQILRVPTTPLILGAVYLP
jgi:hypothetical protein